MISNCFIRIYKFFHDHRSVCWLSMVLLFGFFGWQASHIYIVEDTDKHDLATTIAGPMVLILMFLQLYFKRWDTISLLILPVAFGTIFGLAIMYWLKSEFSLLALGISGVVLGVALSYVLHMLTHQQFVSDTEQLLRELVKPLLLCCMTTIGSFTGLLFVKTDLLHDFGLLASFVILGTTLFSLTYLPQLLSIRKTHHSPKTSHLSPLITYPIDRNKLLIVVIILVTIVCIGASIVGDISFDADTFTNQIFAPLHQQEEMSDELSLLLWLSMAFVFWVLWMSFHYDAHHTLVAFAPIWLSWLIVRGVMVLFGVQFNLISIFIPTIIFGIGVDISMFIMYGLISETRILYAHKTAILLSAIVLITMISSMLFAHHPAICSVGFTSLVGLLSVIILSYILQPAISRWLNKKNDKT